MFALNISYFTDRLIVIMFFFQIGVLLACAFNSDSDFCFRGHQARIAVALAFGQQATTREDGDAGDDLAGYCDL